MNVENRIHIVVVKGTVRPGSYTSRAADLVVEKLEEDGDVSVDVVDPTGLTLPFPGEDPEGSDAPELRERVAAAHGVVMATPEYHGSFSAVLKLMIENLGFPSMLSGKPVALLGVAGGEIGAIKSLEGLRSVCSHVGAIVMPGPVSVPRVRSVFEKDGAVTDERMARRIQGVGTGLLDYLRANVCPRIALEAMVREAP